MRDHSVADRPSTPLELLFDLCFVVAVSFLATQLHHGINEGHVFRSIVMYLFMFIPIWWAWMNYTWFATAFNHDDPINRVLTAAQMLGILTVAAGIPMAYKGNMLPVALCYAAMRVPLIIQWIRSAIADQPNRQFALIYAIGAIIAQVFWIIGAAMDDLPRVLVFLVALMVEFLTPALAVRRAPGKIAHLGHIAERYGLFTIIVLGESILAITIGLGEVIESEAFVPSILGMVAATLIVAFALWWFYFDTLSPEALEGYNFAAFVWGYGHYFVYAAIAAVGVGLRISIDAAVGQSHIGSEAGVVLTAMSTAIVLAALFVLARLSAPVAVGPFLVGGLGALGVAASTFLLSAPVSYALLALVMMAAVLVHLLTEHNGRKASVELK